MRISYDFVLSDDASQKTLKMLSRNPLVASHAERIQSVSAHFPRSDVKSGGLLSGNG